MGEGKHLEFLNYFGQVFEPFNFMLLLIGTIGGLILGATPGLSPTMAVALLIPFTFRLEPAQGLILLGAAYTSTVAGGAVSAILLKIPGAPANIATTLDGHTMAQKGQGAKALQLGVTVIGTLDTSSVVKGLLSGCIGLWLATIGFDDIMGAQRFIFHPTLGGGINVIPALIGLFAIPQVITMMAKGRSTTNADVIIVQKSPIKAAFAEVFSRKRALAIGTGVGSIIGLIPGVGGQIAGLVAYDQSKKFSTEQDKFGTGHSEGVIAAEAANNAMVGPSLVPLLTLSIPGSPTAAVLLGGLLIHGIFPGTDLFDNHPDVAWTFINSMLIGQVLMCIFGLYVAGLAASVASVPHSVMAAIVLGLAVFGSYSVQHSMGDVYVMASLGVSMYFLERFGFSAAPLVLGLILGPIAESNFIQGSMIANATSSIRDYFFTGPLNLVLIAIVIASIAYSFWMELRNRHHTSKEEVIG